MEPTNPWTNEKETWLKTNGRNVSTRNTNENRNTTITPSHLLASKYVPNNLRSINTAPVYSYIPTKASPSLEKEIERVFCGLVGDNFLDKKQFRHRPKAVKTFNEASFAANQSRKRFVGSSPVSSSSSSSNVSAITAVDAATNVCDNEAALKINVPSIGKAMDLGGPDETGTIQHYLAVFRELLQIEQVEIQRLYMKSYDQYEIKITDPPNSLKSSKKKIRRDIGVAQFKVAGIADGRPSIKPGDTVLIRPHQPVLMPAWRSSDNPKYDGNNSEYNNVKNSYSDNSSSHIPYPQQPMIFPNQQSHHPYPSNHQPSMIAPQMVEIVARVLAVNRAKVIKKKGNQKDQVLISWVLNKHLNQQVKNHFCTVRLIPASTTHERCLTALDWLRTIDPVVARDLLFPSTSPKLPPPPAIDESNTGADTTEEREYEQLNTNQARFVQMVSSRTAYSTKERVRPPMVLTGPAGTGKTKTLLAAILQILHRNQNTEWRQQHQHNQQDFKTLHSRILICTPSHTACDVITERLVNLLSEEQQKEPNHGNVNERRDQIRKTVFRLYDATRQIESVPIQILSYTRQDGDGGEFTMPDAKELLGFSVIVCTCQDAHLLFLAGLTNSSLRRRRECFKSDIERRLRESGLEFRGTVEGCNIPHFTHLFIDEAAQATEPECLIPLSVVVDDDPDAMKAEIALCGDPRQLGPCIYSPDASEGLQRSLLERLLRLPIDSYGGGRDHLMGPHTADSRLTLDEMIEYSFQKTDYRQHLSVFLNLSYRGHPSFLFMPSKLFYFDKLKSICTNGSDGIWIKAVRRIESLSENAYSKSLPFKQMDWPLVFRGVKGKCTSMAIDTFFGSNCWCNHAEAEVVVEMIQEVIQVGISTASIGVMAPFRAQVVLIRKLLRIKNLGNVNVGMVEDYQSMERHIIILSLTRSNKLLVHADATSGEGLFHQTKRMNVALTRAEHMLVVVGEPNIMRDDNAWAQWLEFCKDNGLWYGERGEQKTS